MAVRKSKGTDATKDDGDRAHPGDRDQLRAQAAPMRPGLRSTVERLIRRTRAGLDYLATH